jgi:hypothetical protein
MGSTNRIVIGMLVVTGLVVAFWVLALSPKRDDASKLGRTATSLKESLAVDRATVAEAVEARKSFAADYGQMVVLGKAVPASDETASLLVQIQQVAERAKVRFERISLSASSGGSEEAAATTPGTSEGGGASSVVAPTESAAATMPLGASIGPAGLAVMPYSLTFRGRFSHVADFIHGLDALVESNNANVAVDGRLITISGFSLGAPDGRTFPELEANFQVTTFLNPGELGLGAGEATLPPAPATGTPAAAITGAAP